MTLQEQLHNLQNFIGYGSLHAPLWILGIEESLGKRPKMPHWSLIREIGIRSARSPVMDMHTVHEQLLDSYWDSQEYSGVWGIPIIVASIGQRYAKPSIPG